MKHRGLVVRTIGWSLLLIAKVAVMKEFTHQSYASDTTTSPNVILVRPPYNYM